MSRPFLKWIALLSAGCFLSVQPSQAISPLPQGSVVVPVTPTQDQPSSPRQQNSFNLELNPPASPFPSGDELPSSEDSVIKPLYQLDPFQVQEKPLRLEISLSRRRVSVLRGNNLIRSYPIAVGRPGWETPTGTYQVRQMLRNPTWINPMKKGISIPGGDPENPLGRFWIGFWTDGKNWIGFHGTPNPKSVGTAASHGCIRMYNKDVEELFNKVSLGTEVKVVK
jgi:lipoprotein-anchoring transpeptidase ErfK/SrfK